MWSFFGLPPPSFTILRDFVKLHIMTRVAVIKKQHKSKALEGLLLITDPLLHVFVLFFDCSSRYNAKLHKVTQYGRRQEESEK